MNPSSQRSQPRSRLGRIARVRILLPPVTAGRRPLRIVSDFHQHGPITTLHRLSDVRLGLVEQAMREAARQRPVRLILPCHAEDVARPALAQILAELNAADWLAEVLVPINGFASREEMVASTRAVFGGLTRPVRLIQCDGSAARNIRSRAESAGLIATDAAGSGKGWNVWVAFGVALADGVEGVLALHDSDIMHYRYEMLLRLCAPAVHPDLAYEFSKGYYRRVTEGVMFGRVTRLFLAPLLRAAIRVAGHHPLLDYLSAFRYPLAGECALSTAVARELPIHSGWGLEIGILCEIHRRVPPGRVCQVELGPNYEHKHRPLRTARGRGGAGLVEMAHEIAGVLVAQMRAEGIGLDAEGLGALATAYRRTAAEAVERHAHDAWLNGLRHDEERERAATAAFTDALGEAIAGGHGTPPALPAWSRLFTALPGVADDLRTLVVNR